MAKRTEYLDKAFNKYSFIRHDSQWFEKLFKNMIDKVRSENSSHIHIIRFLIDIDAWHVITHRWNCDYVQNMNIYGIPVYLIGANSANVYEIRLAYECEYDSCVIPEETIRKYCASDVLATRHMFMENILNSTCGQETNKKMIIKKVIFNDPATIVYWQDGSKTVVKCQEGDTFDPEKGLAMAISKRALGTNKSQSDFNDIFKKWLPKEDSNDQT